MRDIVAGARIALFLAHTLPMMPLQWLFVALRLPLAERLPVLSHAINCRLLNLEVKVAGAAAPQRPVLFVSNHSSWIDIIVLSSLAPVSFVAKHEVAGWPFFGWLAKLQRTVFVERRAARTAEHRDELSERLSRGDNLVLFAEGTSNDGNRVLPFKSAFFAAAEPLPDGRMPLVQPVSIAYTRLGGMPLGRRMRHLYAWYGDMSLLPHLWRVMTSGRGTVEVEFHPPVTLDRFRDRKQLAAYCQAVVAAGVARAISGRPQEPVALPDLTADSAEPTEPAARAS